MTPFEKHAWFNLIVFAAAFGLTAALWAVTVGYIRITPLALLGLWALGPIFYLHQSLIDERTRAIQRHATQLTIWAYWVVFVGAGVLAWVLLHAHKAIPPQLIPAMILGGLVLFVLIHAGVTIVLHRLENWYAGS